MKKSIKVLGICLSVILAIVMVSSNVMALNNPADIKNKINTAGTDNITSAGNSIISVIRILGMILSVGVLMILGIKYMMGSAEEKAEYKKTMMPYVIGAIMVFAITNFIAIIVEVAGAIK